MSDAQTAAGGTLAFLFSDVEGSTRAWEASGDVATATSHQSTGMSVALARHDAVMRDAFATNHGVVFSTAGDAFAVAFPTAHDALAAAIDAQMALADIDWQAHGVADGLRVRIALHVGPAQRRGDDYFGPTLNRAARILATGHGGQVLLSEVAAGLARDTLLPWMALRDLGEHRLKDLSRPERIFQLDCPPLPTTFPALRTLESRPHNLPPQLTAFVGREALLASIAPRLREASTRLLTLVGPGGTGKTRLALQLAADALETFSDGAFFVGLEPVREPGNVAAAIATALGLSASGPRPLRDVVADYVRAKHLLLILDNFEHVIDAATLVADLLRAAPRLTVVVTSREILKVSGEQVAQVPAFDRPSYRPPPTPEQLTQHEAVRLFIDRATSVRADFAVTTENAPAIAEICYRLDGLPLAIELAAARVRTFPPPALLQRLARGLNTALAGGGGRDVTSRQRTLDGAIAWSYDLLSADERTLLLRLCAFSGGFTFEMAEFAASDPDTPGVVGDVDVVTGVEGLADKSLIGQEATPDGSARFRMLETIREFTHAQARALGIDEDIRSRHLTCMVAVTEAMAPSLESDEAGTALDLLERERDNLREALDHAVASPADPVRLANGVRIMVASHEAWKMRLGTGEARAHLDRLMRQYDPLVPGSVATPEVTGAMPSAIVADARVQVARNGTIGYGLPAWLVPALREAVETYGANGDRRREARAITSLATTHGMIGDVPDAFVIDLATQGATRAESAGDLPTASNALVRAGITHLEGGNVITAGHVLERALALATRARNGSAITDATSILGITRFTQQRWAEAHALFHSLAGRGADAAFMPQVWEARTNLALGRWESARTILDRARGHADRLGDAMMRAVATFWLGEVARAAGDRDDAAALYAEALAVMDVPDALGHYSRAHLGLAILADEAGDIAGARAHLVAATEAPAETLSLQLPEMLATIAGIVAKHDPHVAALAWASAQAIMAQTRTNPVIPHDATRVGAIVDAVRIHLGDGAMASPPTTNDAAIALARTATASLPA